MNKQEMIDKLAKINNLVLALADAGYEDDDGWEKYQYTHEGRNVIIDRLENNIRFLINQVESGLKEG